MSKTWIAALLSAVASAPAQCAACQPRIAAIGAQTGMARSFRKATPADAALLTTKPKPRTTR
jgi:anti-anti-sigma regulatory factor